MVWTCFSVQQDKIYKDQYEYILCLKSAIDARGHTLLALAVSHILFSIAFHTSIILIMTHKIFNLKIL